VQPVNRRTVRPGLRSENSQYYYVPRVHTKLGERAFSYAGPVVWNNLPLFLIFTYSSYVLFSVIGAIQMRYDDDDDDDDDECPISYLLKTFQIF